MSAINEEPTTIVIFGATGDLSAHKLFPSLYELHTRKLLPDKWHIVGVSRGSMSDDAFRTYVKNEALNGNVDDEFLSNLSFVQADLTRSDDYRTLEKCLQAGEQEHGCVNRLLYLAVPPKLYIPIIDAVKESGISRQEGSGWRRVLIEKPFGYDLKSARELDSRIARAFAEEDVFRIDHYLAKDVTQNILAFRFSNSLFESAWNNKLVEHVHLRLYEEGGVEHRGSFYEEVGALRDVGQNHLLQMLALVTMEHPQRLDSKSVSRERERVLRTLKQYDSNEITAHAGRGQYAGYRDIQGVPPDSNTETYFALRTFIENERWRGVPFTLEAGKCMPENRIDIEVHFKAQMPCVCGSEDLQHGHGNVVTFCVKPTMGIAVRFWAKKPGIDYELEEQELGFTYNTENGAPDAYVKLLRNALTGDRLAFPSADEIEAAWAFVTPILDGWRDTPFTFYEPGTCPDPTKLIT